MRKLITTIIAGLSSASLFAQLNGTYNIPGSYASLAAAISDLNLQGISGPVTFSIVGPYAETSPVGGYTITATGTSANPITITATGGATITAYAGGTGTPGTAVQDGIFHVAGGDYITFNGLTIIDPNTTNPSTMEYGIGFFKASPTDGCQYCAVTNCTISLSYVNNATGSGPSFEGSKGIMFINAQLGTATTSVNITSPSGSHSFNNISNNVIANTNYGIVFTGFADASPYANADKNNTITFNNILNFGGATGATNASAGIRVRDQINLNITNDFFNNNFTGTGAYHPSTLRGIYLQGTVPCSITSVSSNTFNIISGATTSQLSVIENAITTNTANVLNINNNLMSNSGFTTSATSAVFYGIYNNAVGTGTLTINNNTITGITSSASGSANFIYVSGTHNLINIQNNSINSSTLTTTGTAYMIYNSNATPNSVVTGNVIQNISKTGTSGNFYGYYNFGSPSGGNVVLNNNLVNNVNIAGSGTVYGLYHFTSSTQTLTALNNTVTNITSGTGTTYGIDCYYTNNFSNNLVQNISGGGTVYGLYYVGTTNFPSNVSNNTISSISTTATTVYGVYAGTGNANNIISNNKITNVSSSNASATVYGLYFAGGPHNTFNNLIGDLLAPAASGTNVISGIYVSSGNQNIYHNTVRLNATSTGANFGTSAIYASTTPNVLLQNNILINNSTPNGTGVTAAYRRSGSSLTTYDNASNNNIFYAGTPSANNAIFTDGTNTYTTLTAYKTAVAPRDASSQTENTQFLSLTPSNANYLHVDGTVASYAESGGLTVSSVSVDIDGDIRQGFPGYTGTGTAPDIGADEFNGISMGGPNDAGVSAFISPTATGCYSSNENVVVTIKNYGTASQTFIPVQVWVSGALTQTLTSNYSGTLNSGASTNFTVGNINMTAAGSYTLKAFTSLTGDSNTSNDTMVIVRNVAPTYTLPQQVDFTGFTGANLPSAFSGWYEATGTTPTGTTSLWTSQTGVGTATNVTARINLYTTTRNEWIIGPKIVPTANTILKFDAAVTDWNSTTAADVMGSDDKVRVMISTDCGLTFTPIYTISAANNLPPTLTSFIIPLNTYSNQPIIVAFYATDGPIDDVNDYDFHLDNINIYNGIADDLASTSVNTPNPASNCLGNENVNVTISNNGFNSATNFTVTSVLSGANASTISTVYTNTLNAFASTTINVGSVNMSNTGTYTLTTYITYPADGNNTNDTIITTYNNIVLPFPMLETFDAVAPLPGLPSGWVSDNGSTSYDFTVRTTGSSIQHGAGNPPTQGITADLYSGNATSWFETPSIGALPNQPVELSFVYRIVNYTGYANPGGTATTYSNNDSLKVLVSSNCGTSWNLVGFINGANHTVSTNFAQKSFCLGNTYAGQNIKLRFEAKWSTGDYWFDIDSVKVDVAPNPVITPSNSLTVCENAATTATVSGGVSYTWNPGAINTNTLNINTSTAGTITYTVDATLPSGCVTSEVLTVTVNPNPTVSIVANPSVICSGQTITLTASGANNYTWTPISATGSVVTDNPTVTTTYSLIGEQNGCFDNTSITVIVNPNPSISSLNVADATQPSCNNGSATITVSGGTTPYSYVWSGSTSTINVATGLNGSGGSGTTHTVTIIDSNGCSVYQTFTISCVTGVESMMNAGIMNVYPNPNNGVFTITTIDNTTKNIRILDVTGRMIKEISTNDKDVNINIENFSRGIYLLEIRTDKGIAKFNVVKE
ncbi:MAG: T9SS type A sorting domain-containing protein [Bacteroidota bacterium]